MYNIKTCSNTIEEVLEIFFEPVICSGHLQFGSIGSWFRDFNIWTSCRN